MGGQQPDVFDQADLNRYPRRALRCASKKWLKAWRLHQPPGKVSTRNAGQAGVAHSQPVAVPAAAFLQQRAFVKPHRWSRRSEG
jgi:hypothetical protein